jgi:hypothetical protein
VRVEYSAPAECPAQGAFEEELANTGDGDFARLGELAWTSTVDIEGEPSGFRALVELVDRDHTASPAHASSRSAGERSGRTLAHKA